MEEESGGDARSHIGRVAGEPDCHFLGPSVAPSFAEISVVALNPQFGMLVPGNLTASSNRIALLIASGLQAFAAFGPASPRYRQFADAIQFSIPCGFLCPSQHFEKSSVVRQNQFMHLPNARAHAFDKITVRGRILH